MNSSIRAIVLVSLAAVAGLAKSQEREWTAKSGHQVTAALENVEAGHITLRIPGRPAPVKVPIDALVPADQQLARRMWLDQQDKRQFDLVVNHLRSVQDRPKTVVKLLIEIHNAIPESPYAGLWASVAMGEGTNEHTRAATILRQVIDRIASQRDIDENRHSMTLASANNNLAVCLIKDRKGDSAAAKLIDAIESRSSVPPVVRSNAELLNELATVDTALIKFSEGPRDRLMRALAFAETSGAGTSFERGWHYSLDFDVPSESAGAAKFDGIDAPRPELQLLSQGTGFVVAPGIVLTSKRVVETTNYNGPKLVTLIVNPLESSWQSEIVQNVSIETVQAVATGGTTQSGSTSLGQGTTTSNNVYTNYDYVRSPDGHSSAELAALRVPNLRVKPLEIAKVSPQPELECVLWGFGRGKDNVSRGVQRETGKVLNAQVIPGSGSYVESQFTDSRVMQSSARVLGGNRGGPMSDTSNLVIGIAFDTPAGGSSALGWFFGAGELRRWFYRNVQTSSILDPTPDLTAEDRLVAIHDATLPIFVWGVREKSDAEVFSLVADSSRNSGGIFIRDGWCIACDGRGFLKCPVKGCNQGVVGNRQRAVVGADPTSGAPIFGAKVVPEKCDACSGKGGSICPHCKSGRI